MRPPVKRASRKKAARKAPRTVTRRRVRATVIVEEKPAFQFEFLGFRDGWYALRADMTPGKQPWASALEFETEIVEWLYNERITIGKWSWVGNGNVHTDRPQLPVPEDGSHFGILLKRPADVIRFEMRFPCLGITPEAMMDALRGEATTARLSTEDITRIAYEANMRLDLLTGSIARPWEDVSADDRLLFEEGVRLHIANPKRTDEEIHTDWMLTMHRAGWRYGSAKDSLLKTHPAMIPFAELPLLEKTKDRLYVSIVSALLPLLSD
jgi:hypothetical protein